MSITGEILLWRAVIDRAARDAFGCTDSSLYRHQAMRWFFQKSPQSFCFVCDLAELDPDAVRDHFFKALMTKNMGASSKGTQMVITCQKIKNRGAHSVTVKPAVLDGFIRTTIIQNIGGFAAKSARMPLAAGGSDSHDSNRNKGSVTSVPNHIIRNAQILFNHLAKHASLAAPIGSLTVADLIKWCQIIDEASHGE